MAASVFVPNPRGLFNLLQSPTGDVARFSLRTAIRVENLAKAYCPVDTGRLRASIGVEQVDGNGAIVAARTQYAVYVELGTSRQRAQPYLRPALAQVIGTL